MPEQSENKGSLPSDMPPGEKAFFDSIRRSFLEGGTPILNESQNDPIDTICNKIYCSGIEAITKLFNSKDPEVCIIIDLPSLFNGTNPDILLQININILNRILVLWEERISQELNKGTRDENGTLIGYRFKCGVIEKGYPPIVSMILFVKSKV